MGRASFQKLEVYQLSEQLADEVWHVVERWQAMARSTVGMQLIRSADSVGANIAEGVGRASYRDNCRFIAMTRGSLYETIHWLRRAYSRNLLEPAQVKRLKDLTAEIGPRLNAYLRSIRKRARKAGGAEADNDGT